MSDESLWSIGPGWVPLVRDLEKRLDEFEYPYTLVQCKEKFGGLRYYATFAAGNDSDQAGVVEKMQSVISNFEAGSYFICERCGRYGRPQTIRYWITTLCEKHAEEKRGRRFGDVED